MRKIIMLMIPNSILLLRDKDAYVLIWIVMRNRNNVVRAILLSVIPSVIFVFSGIMILSIPFIKATDMTAEEMMEYDVKNNDNIISVAIIRDGDITYKTYGSEAEEVLKLP